MTKIISKCLLLFVLVIFSQHSYANGCAPLEEANKAAWEGLGEKLQGNIEETAEPIDSSLWGACQNALQRYNELVDKVQGFNLSFEFAAIKEIIKTLLIQTLDQIVNEICAKITEEIVAADTSFTSTIPSGVQEVGIAPEYDVQRGSGSLNPYVGNY